MRRRALQNAVTGITVGIDVDIVGDTGPSVALMTGMSQNATMLNQILAPYESSLATASGLSLATVQSGMTISMPPPANAQQQTLPVAAIAAGTVCGFIALMATFLGTQRLLGRWKLERKRKELLDTHMRNKLGLFYHTNVLFDPRISAIQAAATVSQPTIVVLRSPSRRNSASSPKDSPKIILAADECVDSAVGDPPT